MRHQTRLVGFISHAPRHNKEPEPNHPRMALEVLGFVVVVLVGANLILWGLISIFS